MRTRLRWLVRGLIGLLGTSLVLMVAAIVTIRIAERRIAASTRIETPNGIESLESVTLGGVDQSILLRGRNRDDPVLLFLHGGPGVPEMPAARDFGLRLEEAFVVVHWDQRGAGKSCSPGVPDESIHLEPILADTLELVDLLRDRFGVEKIYLVGHSWGSVLGILAVKRHPDRFHAYVGIGQVVDMQENEEISYRFVVDRAKAEGNEEALKALSAIHPPYPDREALMTQRAWLGHYRGDFHAGGGFERFVRTLLVSPEYTLREKLSFYGCAMNSLDQAWDDLADVDFIRDAPRLEVPVYFFVGRHDYNTPFELVERYFAVLEAPHKEIVWFEDSAHSPNLEEPERFQEMLIRKVLKPKEK